MSDFPQRFDINGAVISSATSDSIGVQLANVGLVSSVGVWPAANLALFVPFRIASTLTVAKMFWNNNTAGTTSYDVGIYSASGSLLVSIGSTLSAGTTNPQVVDITDTTLTPGLYYMAMAANNVTDSSYSYGLAIGGTAAFGVLEAVTSFPLPSTVTFAKTARARMPLIGMTMRTTV